MVYWCFVSIRIAETVCSLVKQGICMECYRLMMWYGGAMVPRLYSYVEHV